MNRKPVFVCMAVGTRHLKTYEKLFYIIGKW